MAGRGAMCDSRFAVTDAAAGATCDDWPAITVYLTACIEYDIKRYSSQKGRPSDASKNQAH